MPATTPTDLSADDLYEILARSAVYYAGRHHLNDLTNLDGRTLLGHKVLTDLLVTGHSIPQDLPDAEQATVWLARELDECLRHALTLPARDDLQRQDSHRTLNGLRSCLLEAPRSTEALTQVFDQLCDTCHDVYGDAWVKPRLDHDVVTVHPGAGNRWPDPYGVTAITTPGDVGGPATVTLRLYLRDYGPASFAAVPRVLAHECFCHAVTGHRDGYGHSIFAEGWMDWAADLRLRQWQERIDATFALSAGEHGDRLTHLLPTRTEVGYARKVGRDHAEALCRWFQRESGCPRHAAEVLTARLALEINLADRPLAAKDRATERLRPSGFCPLTRSTLAWWAGQAPADPQSAEKVIDVLGGP